jgi:TadE-like protein
MTRLSARGATLIEFALVLLLGVLPMVLGILQIAALIVAHNTVNFATFMAARQGAVARADANAMRREFARGLLPLYAPAARSGLLAAPQAARAYAAALGDVLALDELRVESPTRAQVAALAQVRERLPVIPNDSLEYRSAPVQNANVLTIVVTHCQRLVVPLVGPALAGLLATIDLDAVRQRCYALGRAPLRASARMVMQSDTPIAALPP